MGNGTLFKSLFSVFSKNKKPQQTALYRSSIPGAGTFSGAKWRGGLSSPGKITHIDHKTTRQNVRQQYHQSLQCKAIVDRSTDTVVATGLIPEADPDYKTLGKTPEEVADFRETATRRFQNWCNDKRGHRSEVNTLYQNQRLWNTMAMRDNDQFVRLFYSTDSTLMNPLQYELLDPDQIVCDSWTNSSYQLYQYDGIKRDSRGRELSYDVQFLDHSTGEYRIQTIPRKGAKSGKVFMLHGYKPVYPGQGRGYSMMHHAIQELENITDFSQSVIKKAINQANIVMYVKPSADAPASNPTEGISDNYGQLPGYVKESGNEIPKLDTSDETLTGDTGITFTRIPEADVQQPGSTSYFNLQAGEDLGLVKTESPSDSFNDYVYAVTSHIAASVGMPVEHVLMKYSSNYMAARGAMVMAWRSALIMRREMESDFLNPLYEMWLDGEIAAGRLQAPGWSDPMMRKSWSRVNWVGTPMPHLDPTKEIKAKQDEIALSMTNVKSAARELYGSDYDSNVAINKVAFEDMPAPYYKKDERIQQNTGGQGFGE